MAGGGLGAVYSQNLNHLSNIRRGEYTRTQFLSYLEEDINTCKIKGDKIILMGGIAEYILSKKIRSFTNKLELWEIIIDRHGSMGTYNIMAKKTANKYT